MEKSRETKSLLAKLMASENINVEYHNNASTAAFSTESRTLIMPVLKDMTENSTDLFLGHEVGHALYTPNDAIKEAFSRGSFFKGLCNIVEDARIEKMIQNKFPGLKRSFYDGYSDLIERNFFGTKDRAISSYNFVDRLNIHFKLGVRAGVEFSDEEKVFVDRMENLRSWDDSITLAEDLWKYVGDSSEPETQPQVDPDGEPGDGSDDSNESEGSGNDSDSKEEKENNNTSAGDPGPADDSEEAEDSEESDDGEASEEEDNNSSSNGEADNFSDNDIENPEDLESDTQKEFDRSVRSHLDDSGFENRYGNVPDVDIEKVLISLDEIHSEIDNAIKSMVDEGYISRAAADDGMKSAREGMKKFTSEQKSLVSYLAKEFEMRKSADEHKRTKVAKTGILNPNKLHAYKFSEDLFLRSNVVSDGKNHGFVMFLDWSGSMKPNLANTIDQLMLIALFCKKVNIPFDVFAFSNGWRDDPNDSSDTYYHFDNISNADFGISKSFKLFHLISSTVSTYKFNESMVYLTYLKKGFDYNQGNGYCITPDNLRLGGTPLNEAVMSAFNIIPMFQKKNKVQIVNTVFLTDGQGHDSRKIYNSKSGEFSTYFVEYDTKSFVVDPVTKKHYKVDSKRPYATDTELFIEALGDRTDSRLSNFYIASGKKNTFSQDIAWLAGGHWEVINEQWEAAKVDGYSVMPEGTLGFGEFYVITDKNLKVNAEEKEIDSSMTKAKMKNNFIKNRKNKLVSKKMLSRFAEFVS